MSLAPATSVDSTEHAIPDFKRPIVNFSPSIWRNVFLQYDSESVEINGNMKQQVEMEKDEVKKMFLFSRNDSEQNLNFIDSLQRLGISYHFEREIDEALEQIHNTFTNNKEITTKEGSLHFLALAFRLLRQNRHHLSAGMWWKKTDFATEVPYVRDRVVEAYFWPLCMSYEPKYTTSRKIVGKLVACISLLDDTYDAYGTVEELELFTQAIQRWDFSLIQSLPKCMKVVFNTIVELWDEIVMILVETGKSNLVLQYIKEEFYKLAQSYLVETKWCNEGFIPTYDEYKANGIISSTLPLQILSFLGFGEFSNKELFDWIFSDPKIIEAVSAIGRLADDISSHKFEQQRVHVASSREEAYKLIQIEIEDYWIIMNEECLKIENIPRSVLEIILNVARITEFTYENFEDKYTKAELMKDYIVALLIDPIRIEQCK
ncbi:putative gamma-muurolene synthase [Medicago truncatula]|uniref:Putative gamma-muurolene synthase n=1 Tax=Medicago truncatula TaxID=3880 RepID=A0A396JJK2_MEDTR|nr:putative gamma-muurolene synthase [Medicago truncatula]